MLAYLAFKALTGSYPYKLKSPVEEIPWEFNRKLQLPVLEATKGTFDAGHGVYAATVEEAQMYAERYQGAVYLVAPLPGKHAVVGEKGWRAEGALCLGPLTQENQPEVARLILAAVANGLPQVPAVLGWAIAVASQAEGVLTRLANEEMLAHGIATGTEAFISLQRYLDEAPHRVQVARRLIALCEAGSMVNAAALRWAIVVASKAEGRLVCPPKVNLLDLWRNSMELTMMEIKERIEWFESLLPYLDQAKDKLAIAEYWRASQYAYLLSSSFVQWATSVISKASSEQVTPEDVQPPTSYHHPRRFFHAMPSVTPMDVQPPAPSPSPGRSYLYSAGQNWPDRHFIESYQSWLTDKPACRKKLSSRSS